MRTATTSNVTDAASDRSTARSYTSCASVTARPTNLSSDAPPSNREPQPVLWMVNQPVGDPVRHPTKPRYASRPSGASSTASAGRTARCRAAATSATSPTASTSELPVGRTRPAAAVHSPASSHCSRSAPTSAHTANAQNSASV